MHLRLQPFHRAKHVEFQARIVSLLTRPRQPVDTRGIISAVPETLMYNRELLGT